MKLFANNKTYSEFQFEIEADFEKEIVFNSKLFFGPNSIYIDAKKKIEAKSLGNSIPDGFLFDLSDIENPEFYIVEAELAKHDFYGHIFPQLTKFFGFYKNQKGRTDLVEKIFYHITNESSLKTQFRKYLGEKEIYKFLKDTVENSQKILLIIDGEKKELPEIMETYSDTWGKMVKLIFLKKFSHEEENIYTMHPEFENIEFVDIDNELVSDKESVEYDESYHLGGTSNTVKDIYFDIKKNLLSTCPNIAFNSLKSYISIRATRNVAYFLFSKKKIRLIVMNSEDDTKKAILRHSVKPLSPSVQKFWNGPSCALIIDSEENLDDITAFLKQLISKT